MTALSFSSERFPAPRPLVGGLIAAITLTLLGCDGWIPPRPPVGQPAPSQAAEAAAGEAVTAADSPADPSSPSSSPSSSTTPEAYEGDWDAWYVHRVGATVVGTTRLQASQEIDPSLPIGGPQRVRYLREERLVFRAGTTQFVRHARTTSEETTDGGVVSLEAVITAGPVVSQLRGTRTKNTWSLGTLRGGETSQTKLAWPEETRSVFAIEQTLRRDPIEKGQTRRLTMLMPSLKTVGTVELICPGDASVAMLDGDYKRLREVQATFFEDGKPVDSLVFWIDPQGSIEKSLRPATRLEAFRTTRSQAEQQFGQRDENAVYLLAKGTLREDGGPPDDSPPEVVFRLSPNGKATPPAAADEDDAGADVSADAAAIPDIPEIGSQAVRRAAGGWRVTVRSAADGQQDLLPAETSDLQPGKLIDSAQPPVTRAADAIGELPAAELAAELSLAVRNSMSLAPQVGLTPASQVIRRGSGGDLDHAVLLAAMLRAREIPARVALGLAPVEQRRGDWQFEAADETDSQTTWMKLSAWVFARIDGRWVNIDPMTSLTDRTDLLTLRVPADDGQLAAELLDLFRKLGSWNVQIGDHLEGG